MSKPGKEFVPLNIAVLTVSDSRTEDTDTSGKALVDALTAAGHSLAAKTIITDDKYKVRAQVAQWVTDEHIAIVLITGGTGMTGRDVTPEAIAPLFDKTIEGFGELFRQVSFEEIGTSTIQSRAVAGISGATLIFCLPGSTGACKTAWNRILGEQLDARHGPCNFVQLLPRLKEK